MANFFSKLFGGKKKETASSGSATVALVEDIMHGIFDRGGFDLSFDISTRMDREIEEVTVQLQGTDEKLLTEQDGAFLDGLQLFIKRVVQHQLPDARVNVDFDCNGFREEANKSLVELAEKLKDRALEQGRSVYLRALPPKDRKIIHQHLAGDARVRSRSVGEGLYKKIKIYPVKAGNRGDESNFDSSQA